MRKFHLPILCGVLAAVTQGGAAAGSFESACGSSGGGVFTTTSSSFQVILQCLYFTPTPAGFMFISADASLVKLDFDYEAHFRVSVDDFSGAGDSATDRWIDVYPNANDGTDKSVAVSILKPVAAGTHVVQFLGRRSAGPGTVLADAPTLTASFVPTTQGCGASGDANWSSTSPTFEPIVQCTLTAPSNGLLFIAADGSLALADNEYEANFRLGLDNPLGDSATDRWVNVYPDTTGDGSDESVAVKVLKPVTAGTHTVSFLGRRQSGSGTAVLYDPSVTAIFVPSTRGCGAGGDISWTSTSTVFGIVVQCTFTAPTAGAIYVTGDASAVLADSAYEGNIRVGIDDSTTGDTSSNRYFDVRGDGGDGTDRSVAVSLLRTVAAGSHTVYLLGRRQTGPGTVRLFDPSLTVEFVGASPSPVFQSGVSRRVHGAAGALDLLLSLASTNPTTEPRQGPLHTIVMTFDRPIVGATVTVTEGTATAASPTFSGNGVVIGLTGVANQQYVTIGLTNVASLDGGTGGSGSVRIGFLTGDVNQNRVVTVADLGLVNAQLAQTVTAANYLKDVNATGTLTVADKGIANANLAKALPAP